MTTYDEYCDKFMMYARAIKEYDRSILIMGPESCNSYHYYNGKAPTDAGKGVWLVYFMRKCADYEAKTGVRILDVLSVHRYPIFRSMSGTAVTAPDQAILDATQAWGDENYIYSGDPTVYGGNGTIPKLRRMIDEHYPGTLLGVAEYNLDFNPDAQYNPVVRALWLADTLGAFAKYGVDFANYWNVQDYRDTGLLTVSNFGVNDVNYGDLNPVYLSFYLMSNYLRGALLETHSSISRLKVYAARHQDSVNIIVINTDMAEDITCRVAVASRAKALLFSK